CPPISAGGSHGNLPSLSESALALATSPTNPPPADHPARSAKNPLAAEDAEGFAEDAMAYRPLRRRRVLCASSASSAVKCFVGSSISRYNPARSQQYRWAGGERLQH